MVLAVTGGDSVFGSSGVGGGRRVDGSWSTRGLGMAGFSLVAESNVDRKLPPPVWAPRLGIDERVSKET